MNDSYRVASVGLEEKCARFRMLGTLWLAGSMESNGLREVFREVKWKAGKGPDEEVPASR